MIRQPFRPLKVSSWPSHDRRLWGAAQRQEHPFDDAGRAAGWSKSTLRHCERHYGVFLAWLESKGMLDEVPDPCARVTKPRLKEFLAEYSPGRAPLTVAGTVRDIALTLRACVPPDGLSWLNRVGFRMMNTGVTDRPKLPRMAGPASLISLAEQLMGDGLAAVQAGYANGAVDYRDGLIIYFLVYRPLRVRNLSHLRIGKDILISGSLIHLDIPASATKKGVPVANTLPLTLCAALRDYLVHIRPVLLRSTKVDPEWLWVGRRGNRLTEAEVAVRVKKMCSRHLGKDMTPHLFRDISATQIAISAPHMIGITKDVLNHASAASGQSHYNQASSLTAVKAHSSIIGQLRGHHEEEPSA